MISITSKSRYAVVAMAELARSGERPVPIKELAERRGIPEQFLEQLFSTLRRAGLLTSHRGMKGGYTLSRPADEITVLEVVQTLDGKVGQEADEAGGIWAEGVTALRKVFGQTTIAEVARREAEEAGSRDVLHLDRAAPGLGFRLLKRFLVRLNPVISGLTGARLAHESRSLSTSREAACRPATI